MNIELIGLPGSGKSTIAKSLNQSLEPMKWMTVWWESKVVESNKYYLLVCLTFRYMKYLLHPTWFAIWCSLDVKSLKIILPSFLLKNLFVDQYEQEVKLFDEGFLQTAYSLFHKDNKFGDKYLDFFLNHVNLPDVLIVLDIDENIAYDRMIERKRIPLRLKNKTKNEILYDLSMGREWINSICDKLILRDILIYKIDSSKNLDLIIDELKNLKKFTEDRK